MGGNNLMDDVGNSYQSLKELMKSTREFEDDMESLYHDDEDYLQSLIDYNVNDALNTLPSMNNYVDIQFGDMSEDVRRNAVINIYNYTKDMNLQGVKNLRIDYDGNIELNYISSHLDLDNLVIKNVDVFSWHNLLPYGTVGTIRFESCGLAKHYSVKTLSDDVETSLDFIFENTAAIGKIECVNCSNEFVDALMLGIDKIDENHRFGDIEIEIK